MSRSSYCLDCGNPLVEGANFCPSCGAPQNNPAESPRQALRESESALAELRSHWLMTGRPVRVGVYESGIEFVRSDPLRRENQRMSYGQIAQVAVKRGLVFSTLVIESRGGGTIVAEGLPRGETDQAVRLIEERLDS